MSNGVSTLLEEEEEKEEEEEEEHQLLGFLHLDAHRNATLLSLGSVSRNILDEDSDEW